MHKSPKLYKTPKKDNGAGAYGTYYILDKEEGIGVKRVGWAQSVDEWKELINDELECFTEHGRPYGSCLSMAAHELAALVMLAGVESVPDGYELVWMENNGYYFIGIVMEHVDGKTFYEHFGADYRDEFGNDYYDLSKRLNKTIGKEIEKHGIKVFDWHGGNVMKDVSGKDWRIDFTQGEFDVDNQRLNEYREIAFNAMLEVIAHFPG